MAVDADFRRIARIVQVRRAFAEVIARLPFNSVRCFLYRCVGYRIRNSSIGWGTVIAIEKLEMTNASIGTSNKIVGPFRMIMCSRAALGSDNFIVGGFWALRDDHHQFMYKRELILEEHAVVTGHHWIDVIDRIRIGAGTHVAGIRSQFWTHGYSASNRDIDIGIDCFVGSGCIFTPGSGLADRSIVGSGSVVTKKHNVPFSLLSGNPAKQTREKYYWRTRNHIDPSAPPALPDHIRHLSTGGR